MDKNSGGRIKLLVFLRYMGCQGGVQRVADSYYSRFDKKRFDIEYLVLTHEDLPYEQKLMDQGTKIYTLKGIEERNIFTFFRSCQTFFSKNKDYDIIHCHQTNFDFIPLFWARFYGIPIRIIHSHNTGYNINLPQFLCEKYLTRLWASHFMAASRDSGYFLFGKRIMESGKCEIMTNAIEIPVYAFDPKVRKRMRKELSIPDDTVVFCQIARLSPEKRQEITLAAFQEIHERYPDSRLYFVGSGGEYEALVRKQAEELSVGESVIFLGARQDVPGLLQAFDIFVMPSLFEGMIVALIEALAAGMPCLISDKIGCALPDEHGVVRVERDAPIDAWVDGMEACMGMRRKDNTKALCDAGFSIDEQAERLQKRYEEMCQ